MTKTTLIQPLYNRAWQKIQNFPSVIRRGSHHPPQTSGEAAAVLISGGLGSVTMMVSHHLSETSKLIDQSVTAKVGAWMPGANNPDPMWGSIGSYAGKETFMLIGWLVSLAILYPLLRNKPVKPRTIFFWLFSLYTLATAMSWHPLFPYLPLH